MKVYFKDYEKLVSKGDYAIALRKVAEDLQSMEGEKILEFEKKIYDVYKDYSNKKIIYFSNTDSTKFPEKSIGIYFEGIDNLTIEGNGALFIFHGDMTAFGVFECKDIRIKNISWDYFNPTVGEMKLVDTGFNENGQFSDFEISKDFAWVIENNKIKWMSEKSPYTNQTYWSRYNQHNSYGIIDYNPNIRYSHNTNVDLGPLHNYSGLEIVNEKLRVYYEKRPENQVVGKIFVMNSSSERKTCGAFITESKNIEVKNCGIHFLHGFGFLLQMSEKTIFENCKFTKRENSEHYTTSYADSIHVSGHRGEIEIKDSEFESSLDDFINIHGTYLKIESLEGKELILKYMHKQQSGFNQYHVGDEIAFIDKNLLEVGSRYFVEKVVAPDGMNSLDITKIILDRKVENTIIQNQGAIFVENITYSPSVKITGNIFRNTPTRAILCTARGNTKIENNEFYNCSMSSIYISNDVKEWYESGKVVDFEISNNYFFVDKSIEDIRRDFPIIWINPITHEEVEEGIHEKITIEKNIFNTGSCKIIEHKNVKELVFRDNIIK